MIEVEGLRRSYGRVEAVRGVSLQVRRGELFALLGTNGAGKTTTIEVLEGLQRPTAGRVRVLGMDPIDDRARLRPRTGMMLQDGGFTGALTVHETIEVWRSLTAGPRPTAEALELVELGERADVAVERLSGGERRRLELALALLGRPELLFLDEPTTGMDPASRRRTWEVIRELLRDGATVLLTTHYLEEAEALAARVAIMHEGSIVVTGTPEEVMRRPPGRITFREPDDPRGLPDLPGTTVSVEAGRVTVESRQLQADLTRLLGWADEHAIELAGLAARPASLEDVFLDVLADSGGSR
ncbi:MAG TPA: ABC transporter ATP-binding protein [Solirubrobacteraceae bacterium]|nr:ABC transporter ATP-binding protein [Solirubrobacteraceae bacterium]